jgi:hypothetical protein
MPLARAARRAALAFALVLALGGGLLGFVALGMDKAPVAAVVEQDPKPLPLKAPQRPARYPDSLPTLDNVSMIGLQPESGALLITLVSPATPADTVDMVATALEDGGWEAEMVRSSNRLLGSASNGDTVIGIEVSGDARDGTPTGWITIRILLREPPKDVLPVPQPVQPPELTS